MSDKGGTKKDGKGEDFGPYGPEEAGYIDLPFESGSADPQPLKYADLGEQYRYDPNEDFADAQKRAKGGDDGS